MGISGPSCAARCRDHLACDCFVYAASNGQCWMRANCSLDYCAASGGEYNTYLEPRAPAGYTSFGANCYHGHGAVDLDTAPATGISASSCAVRCNADNSCDCFVYAASDGKCWKRANCTLSSCAADGGEYTTYLKSEPPADYKASDVNCYAGHGATDVGDRHSTGISSASCAAQCDTHDTCDCFVYAGTGMMYWLRANCTVSSCAAGGGVYETYTRINSSKSVNLSQP